MLRCVLTAIGLMLMPLAAVGQGLAAEISGGVTAIAQHADDHSIDDAATASADLFITVPRPSGEWFIYLEGNTTPADSGVATRIPESNADAGSALDEDRRGRLQLSEFNYSVYMGGARLTAGLIDPSAYLDRSRITNDENVQFLGVSFVNNPTIEFPDYSLGMVYQRSATDGWPEFNLVVSSSHGLADNPNLSYAQLLSVDEEDKGLFAAGGIGWKSEGYLLRLGGWLHTAPHTTIDGSDTDAKNYGLYSVIGRSLGDHGINLRLGWANPEVSTAERFVSLAYRRKLGDSAFGIGLSHTMLADDARSAEVDDTTQFETFYRYAWAENIHLTPSLQHIINSGFDSSGSSHAARVTIIALRFHYSF